MKSLQAQSFSVLPLGASRHLAITNTKTIDTVLHAMEGLVSGASSATFVILTFLGSLPLSFLVGGGAAGAALTMPVLAPLGDFASVDRALVITTWGAAAGWLRLIAPVNAILVARPRPRESGLREREAAAPRMRRRSTGAGAAAARATRQLDCARADRRA